MVVLKVPKNLNPRPGGQFHVEYFFRPDGLTLKNAFEVCTIHQSGGMVANIQKHPAKPTHRLLTARLILIDRHAADRGQHVVSPVYSQAVFSVAFNVFNLFVFLIKRLTLFRFPRWSENMV